MKSNEGRVALESGGIKHKDIQLRAVPASIRAVVPAVHVTALRVSSSAITFGFGILAARWIGADQFGRYVSWMAVVSLVSVLASLGIPTLIGREVASARGSGEHGRILPLSQGVPTLLTAIGLVTVLGAPFFGAVWVALGALILLNIVVSLLGGVHAGFERVLFINWVVNVAQPFSALLVLALIVWSGERRAMGGVFAQVAASGFATFMFGAMLLHKNRHHLTLVARLARAGPLWSDAHYNVALSGLMFAFTQLMINATTQIDILILSGIRSSGEVAHYFAAARAATVVSFLFGSCAALTEPKIIRLYAAGDISAARKTIASTARLGFLLTVLVGGGAALGTRIYLNSYGRGFLEAERSMYILIASMVVWSAFGPAQVALRATRRDGQLMLATATAIASNALCAYLLIPHIGMDGAAIGTGLQLIVYGAVMAVASWRASALRSDIFHSAAWRRAQ